MWGGPFFFGGGVKRGRGGGGAAAVGTLFKDGAAEHAAVALGLDSFRGLGDLRSGSLRGGRSLAALELGQGGHELVLVVLLDLGHALEEVGDVVIALLPRHPGEIGVHAAPLAVLPPDGGLEVGGSGADAGGLLIEQAAVDPLILGHGLEERGHLLVPLLPGLVRKEEVLVPGHGLSAESCQQILFGLGFLKVHQRCLLNNNSSRY